MLKGWILYSKADTEKNSYYIESYINEAKTFGMEIRLVLVEDLEFGIKNSLPVLKDRGNPAILPDFIICRTIFPLLSTQLELLGIPVFNSSKVAKICNDKARTYQYLAGSGIAMVDSYFIKNCYLREYKEKITDNTVIKSVSGHGGSQVFFYDIEKDKQSGGREYEYITNAMKGDDVVFQPMTGNRHQDLRVYVIGKQIIAAVLRTATEGFKSNFSLGGKVELYRLTQKEKKIVEKIIKRFDFDLVGIDFIIGNSGELIFNELEDVVGARMLYQCSDINIVNLYLDHIYKKLNNHNS